MLPFRQVARKAKADGPSGEALARQALDEPTDEELARQIAELSPEEAALFAKLIGLALRKRRWLLGGYLVALAAVLIGMVAALYLQGTYGKERFIGWVFIIPPALAGLVLWLVGRHVKKMT